MKGFIAFIGVINLLAGSYEIYNGFYIFNKATTVMQQTVGTNTGILGAIFILTFIVSISAFLIIDELEYSNKEKK